MIKKGRILSLDLGTKKTGIAISDETQTIARAMRVIFGSTNEQIAQIIKIIEENDINEIVFGKPSLFADTENTFIPDFIESLSQTLTKKGREATFTAVDEDFSSSQAGESLKQIKQSLPRKKAAQINIDLDDAEAARIILQKYCDTI